MLIRSVSFADFLTLRFPLNPFLAKTTALLSLTLWLATLVSRYARLDMFNL